ncbi:hypothetical protein A3K64_03150 [Candidatus Micrarchaeota archaeon RBG_16_36_9]|nr:MAG: hypothetical protein A3K64_03150 [Candidatus Micrarchaeota archaeon RBG_16_36_9]
MLTKDEGRKNLSSIIEMFKKWEREPERLENESDAKTLIKELFERVLGWDKSDIYEERTTGPTSKRADFQFKDRGVTKLILEAKAIGVILDGQKVSQAIGYGWSSNKDYVVLTNFQTIMLFNAKWKDKNKKIFEINIEDCQKFSDKFDLLWKLSKESFSTGEIDRFSIDVGKQWKKVQIQTIDKQLLNDLKKWRETLTKDIKVLNRLSENDIDEVIQKIINRLIFIRVCEDRQLEPGLSDLKSHLNLWKKKRNESTTGFESLLEHLLFVFHYYDKTYDGTIFQKDDLCEKIKINDNILEKIIEQLYVAEGVGVEYNFASIDADVLGYVYEEYLGYLLKGKKITESHTHRKEQGIYYTPTYIVDYIVRNTLGEVLKQNKEIDKIKVLDPACGSGSFLIKAFDVISEFYKENIGEEKFDRQIKNNILTQNIYGVDLDSKAVEIAQLNLFLKIGEKGELPKLRENIKNGNSLINDEKISDRAFKWEEEFEDIMKEGGFDVVIGNPPYVRIQTLDTKEIDFFNSHYKSATKNYDIYSLFVERGLSLLKEGGILGLILPSKFFNADYGEELRKLISEQKALYKIVDFKDFQVFESATTYTCLLFLKKSKNVSFDYFEIINKEKLKESKTLTTVLFKKSTQKQPKSSELWNFVSDDSKDIMNKLNGIKLKLGDVSKNIFQGITTSADKIFILEMLEEKNNTFKVKSKAINKEYILEKDLLKPILKGQEIRRWQIKKFKNLILFPYRIEGEKAFLFDEKTIKSSFKDTWNYIQDCKKMLESREKGRMKDERDWYGYIYRKNLEKFEQPKILTQVLASKNSFTFDEKGEYYFVGGGNAGGYGIILSKEYSNDYYWILSLLNSKVLEFYLRKISTPFRGGFYSYGKRFIEKLPIIIPSKNDKSRLEELSKKQLEKLKRLSETENKKTTETEELKESIERTDKEIDELIYKIYGVTEEEKKVIEQSLE